MVHSFRAFDPANRSGSVPRGQTLAGPQEIGSNQGGLKIVPRIARRVILVSLFVLLLEFNRSPLRRNSDLGERRVRRFAI